MRLREHFEGLQGTTPTVEVTFLLYELKGLLTTRVGLCLPLEATRESSLDAKPWRPQACLYKELHPPQEDGPTVSKPTANPRSCLLWFWLLLVEVLWGGLLLINTRRKEGSQRVNLAPSEC